MVQSTSLLQCVGLLVGIVLVLEVPTHVFASEGQEIGSFYQCAHDFRGKVIVKNKREIVIKGFNYDGKGPAAWFHAQRRGAEGIDTTDPNKYVTLPYPNATCDRLTVGRKYKDEDITLILPDNVKNYETIGILCYEYCHNFGHIVIPSDLEVPDAPIHLPIVAECPKPKYPACSLEKTKNGALTPDCTAGAGGMAPQGAGQLQLVPSVFMVVVGWATLNSVKFFSI